MLAHPEQIIDRYIKSLGNLLLLLLTVSATWSGSVAGASVAVTGAVVAVEGTILGVSGVSSFGPQKGRLDAKSKGKHRKSNRI